jgi:hypothetical protein
MASCESAVSAITNLYKKYGDVAAKIGCTAAGVGVGIASEDAASALQTIQTCLEKKDKVEEAIKKAEAEYESVIGKTSGLTIGPRLLPFDDWQSGTIVSTGERLFLTAAPVPTNNPVLRIRELGGKGQVSITVCSFTLGEHGKADTKKLKDFLVNEDKGEKKEESQRYDITLSGVENRWISVHLDGKSVTNTFKYKIMLDT